MNENEPWDFVCLQDGQEPVYIRQVFKGGTRLYRPTPSGEVFQYELESLDAEKHQAIYRFTSMGKRIDWEELREESMRRILRQILGAENDRDEE